jgi:trimeric autotransporter adhesin
MSTKTTFKRIALVAVAALGFGTLSTAPSSAANAILPTAISVGTIPAAAVGVTANIPVTFTAPITTAADTFTVTVRVTSAPVGSAFASLANIGKRNSVANIGTAGTSFIEGVIANGSTTAGILNLNETADSTAVLQVSGQVQKTDLTPSVSALVTTSGSLRTASTTSGSLFVTFQPDVAGSYTFLVSAEAGTPTLNTQAYGPGDANTTFTVATAVAPTSATLAAVTGATVSGAASTVGRLMKLTLNSGAALGTNQTIALTTNNTSATLQPILASAISTLAAPNGEAAAASLTLDSTHFVNGVAYFKLADPTTTASTTVVTATGSGLLASLGVLSTISSTTTLLAIADEIKVNNGVAAVRPGSGHTGGGVTTSAASISDKAATTATSHTYGLVTTTGATARNARMLVTDTSGKITGIAGLTYETLVSTAAAVSPATTGLGSVSFTATLLNGQSFTATIQSTTNATITVTGETATVSGTTGSATAEPASTMYATHGSSVVATVLVKDQFGAAVANSPVTVSVTGRNATTASVALATDATGRASYTLADAGTAATVLTQSTIVFDTALDANTSVIVNYGADRVAAVALETPTSDDTAATGITYSDINASSTAGAYTAATAQTITATVTDVNGAVLVGVPVTFSTASAGAAILSTTVTVYTDATGEASATVYGWTAGVKTFTATAGTKSATGTVAYRQGGATGTNSTTEARTIEAVMTGNKIVVTAKDRFGNVVSGVPLWGTRTGNGTFGGGSNTNGQTTGVDGTAEFLFNAGSEDSVVTITAGSATATPAPCYAQTGHLAGMNVCSTATTQTAYTASTVGTTTTAETGVGASFAPAGISSVTVAVPAGTDSAQVAADAAAEATDAANAATDAANAAAEAADAATAAAQDAADAVAALSTQVTELVSALRKQITSLTNLVIKIQRKVRA